MSSNALAKPPRRDVWSEIDSPDLLSGLKFVPTPPRIPQLWGPVSETRRGRMRVCDKDVYILIALPALFPYRKPLFFVFPDDALGLLPHVEPDGYVCYVDEENLLLDTDNPAGILRDACTRVRKVLEAGVSGTNANDFVDEFEAYWGKQHPDSLTYRSFVTPGSRVERIWVGCENGTNCWFSRKPMLSTALVSRFAQRQHRYTPALYIPFNQGSTIRPPGFGTMWTPDQLRAIVAEYVSKENQARINELGRQLRMSQHFILFSIPRPGGGHAWFGVRCQVPTRAGKESRPPLVTDTDRVRMTPVKVERADPDYLIERGGGHPELRSKDTLLIGCGAVGSVIADQLAKAGLGNLTLVDHDLLAQENTFRHALGGGRDGKWKVEAIADDLRTRFRFIEINEVQERIERHLKRKPHFLQQFDLVVSATGNPTIELLLNSQIHGSMTSPPAIFTWLEPLGIGGHALLTNYSQTGGCLRCLYGHDVAGVDADEMYNAASFAAPGQDFTKRLSGCRTSFVPYGAVDATQTACLAVRLALDVLRDRHRDNPLLSWKGDSTDFEKAEFHLSRRFEYNSEQLRSARFDYKIPDCDICQTNS